MTELNMLTEAHAQAYAMDKMIREGQMTLLDLEHTVQNYHVNDGQDYTLKYVSAEVIDRFELDMNQVREDGVAHLQKFVHPNDLSRIISRADDHFKVYGDDHAFSFFQRVWSDDDMEYTWYFTTMKRMDGSQGDLVNLSYTLDEISVGVGKLSGHLNEFEYIKKHMPTYARLTQLEKNLLTMLLRGYTLARIADGLEWTSGRVKQARQMVKAKLGMASFSEIFQFAKVFDLL